MRVIWSTEEFEAMHVLAFVTGISLAVLTSKTCVQVSYQDKNPAYFANTKAFSTCNCLNERMHNTVLVTCGIPDLTGPGGAA